MKCFLQRWSRLLSSRGWCCAKSGVFKRQDPTRRLFLIAVFPKLLGLMLGLAGVCYLINTLALLLAPDLADTLFPWIMLPVLVGELSLSLWMIVKGANVKGLAQ